MTPASLDVPRQCFWELTRACRYRCLHCRAAAGRAVEGELTIDEAHGVADQLVALGVRLVVLTGGEPTLHPGWKGIARRLADGGVRVRLFSSGDLGARALKAALNAGVTEIALSLDGPRDIHDRLRPVHGLFGGSSYQRTITAIELLVDRGLAPRVVTTASRVNIPHLDTIHATVRELGVERWQINLCQATGRAREHLKELMPDPEDLESIVAVLLRVARERKILAPMHCSIGYMTEEEPVLRRPRSEHNPVWNGTPAGLRTMAITAAGGVLGCTSLPDEFATASVRQRPLAEIWRDDGCFPYSRGWTDQVLAGECARCPLAHLCRAGCPAVAYGATGSIGSNPYCLRRVRKE